MWKTETQTVTAFVEREGPPLAGITICTSRGRASTLAAGVLEMLRTCSLVLALAGLSGCCDCPCDDPPPIAPPPSSGDETPVRAEPTPPPAPRGVDEARAVEIAMNLAGAEGFDVTAFTDVVVHAGDDGRTWEVQLRRPRILRYLFVVVQRADGAATLEERSQ